MERVQWKTTKNADINRKICKRVILSDNKKLPCQLDSCPFVGNNTLGPSGIRFCDKHLRSIRNIILLDNTKQYEDTP